MAVAVPWHRPRRTSVVYRAVPKSLLRNPYMDRVMIFLLGVTAIIGAVFAGVLGFPFI